MNLKNHLAACWSKCLTLLVLGWMLPLDAQALIDGSWDCNVSGSNLSGYTFAAGAEMKVPFSGTCTAKRPFPGGAYPTLQITNISGSNPARLYGLDPYSNTYMSTLPLGNYGGDCLGGRCAWIPVGGKVSYTYYIGGTAPSTPGIRRAQVMLGVTAIGYPNYAEWIHMTTFIYNVAAVGCSVSSSKTVNLNFGSISTANLNTAYQNTTISVNCQSDVRAAISLTPTQAAVNATGLSHTTLPGLNMQAFWSSNMDKVGFNSFAYKYLKAGPNSIGLSFQPVLEAGKSPAGAFRSQYTLTIDYQ
ncbi:fimbrial protein [Pseudomonas sp. P7]|uniref:fimbrial protein n=1 Tax=Pseudomonas sivasensis TaxID=1880678 RepID=UPI0015ECB65D|nr:fimbrial protein [Pseudomonas sivasensis]MBA2925487.1 fimbrial protein [Pseudomonas sivasensis]